MHVEKIIKIPNIAMRIGISFLVVALLPLLIVSLLTFYHSEQILNDEVMARLSAITDSKAHQIELFFSEEQEQYENAVKLLDKYEQLFGANLDSLIAYARLLDKQGSQDAATEKYKAILLSGYQIPPDLRKYINSRLALNQSK